MVLLAILKNRPFKKGPFVKPPFSLRKPPLKKGAILNRPFLHDGLAVLVETVLVVGT
jgi:hypothetical protein